MVGMTAVAALGATALLNLSGKMCGPPRDITSAIEARGYVVELELSTIIPAEVATRHDLVILFYYLNPGKAKDHLRSTSGVFSQSMIRIIRSDREPGRPLGWACVMDEVPIMENHRKEMFGRAKHVDDAIRSVPSH